MENKELTKEELIAQMPESKLAILLELDCLHQYLEEVAVTDYTTREQDVITADIAGSFSWNTSIHGFKYWRGKSYDYSILNLRNYGK